jgi:cobalt-zinc-cadmium efflux system membrane fusion protein
LGLSDDQIASIDRSAADDATRSQVRSPIAGQVAALDVSVGQVLSGTETLATIADVKDVWASVRVYERDLGSVSVGAPADVSVPTYEGRAFPGNVRFVSSVLDDKSRSAEVRVSVPNLDAALRPGMSATALVERQTGGDELWLPVGALQTHEGNTVVFVHTSDRRFEVRTVVAGAEEGGFRPVRSGILPNDEVVVSGAFALRAELERAGLGE